MEKEVLITIQSSQSVDGQDAPPAELISRGMYSYTPEMQSLSYMESELTGLEGTRTEFSVKPGEVVLSRTGTVTSRMIFRHGPRYHFAYDTPYGAMTMGMETHLMETDLHEDGGSLRIEYELSFENVLISRNKFYINIKETSEKEQEI